MSPQVIIGAKWKIYIFLAMRRGKCDTDNAAYVAGGQPSLLVVIRAVELPSVVLEI